MSVERPALVAAISSQKTLPEHGLGKLHGG
jgi:hypothetical protein